jgi:hypothetical protein
MGWTTAMITMFDDLMTDSMRWMLSWLERMPAIRCRWRPTIRREFGQGAVQLSPKVKLQIPPLRCAPVGMTISFELEAFARKIYL